MKRRRRYKSDAFAAINETAKALHDPGIIDRRAMREFDEACRGRVLTGKTARAANRRIRRL